MKHKEYRKIHALHKDGGNLYWIHRNGTVRNDSGEEVKSRRGKNKYINIMLVTASGRKSFLLHRLIAHVYLGLDLKSKLTVNHIDGDRFNNEISNLEIVTQSKNNILARINGQRKNKLSKVEVRTIRQWKGVFPQKTIAYVFGVSQTFISKILSGKQMSYEI